MSVPKVAYREKIRKKVKVQGRHKKQSGGHGQFGDVWIEFEPATAKIWYLPKMFSAERCRKTFPGGRGPA